MHRRRWLQLGLGAGAVLALGGGLATLVEPGLRAGRLTASSRVVFAAVGRALLDGSLPTSEHARTEAVTGLLERTDALVAALPRHAQAELSQLLALLASVPSRRAFAGLAVPWQEASVGEVQAALQSMRTSTLALRRQAYQTLHDIAGGAYFSEPSTWTVLGYPGPRAL